MFGEETTEDGMFGEETTELGSDDQVNEVQDQLVKETEDTAEVQIDIFNEWLSNWDVDLTSSS